MKKELLGVLCLLLVSSTAAEVLPEEPSPGSVPPAQNETLPDPDGAGKDEPDDPPGQPEEPENAGEIPAEEELPAEAEIPAEEADLPAEEGTDPGSTGEENEGPGAPVKENTEDGSGEPAQTGENTPSAGETDPGERTAEELSLTLGSDRRYAFAGRDEILLTAVCTGGSGSYTCRFAFNGHGVKDRELSAKAGEFVLLPVKPTISGTLKVRLTVKDENGRTAAASVSVALPRDRREDPSDWEEEIRALELTGSPAEDLARVAESQLGYRESVTNYILTEQGVMMGYTRYGQWYGYPYQDWCAMFVSFCAHYASVPEDQIRIDASAHQMQSAAVSNGTWRAAGEYIPKRGDLIFFDKDEYADADHVGIVNWYEDGVISVIEGNHGKEVDVFIYGTDDTRIMGYTPIEGSAEPAEPAKPVSRGKKRKTTVRSVLDRIWSRLPE